MPTLEAARASVAMEAAELLKGYKALIRWHALESVVPKNAQGCWKEEVAKIDACLKRLEEVS